MKKYRMRLLCIGIVAAGIMGAVIFVKTKPEAEKKKRSRMTPVVRSIALEKRDGQARIPVTGTVEARRSVQLKAQVAGRIEETSAEWIEGGRVEKGELLLKLEEADYKTALAQAESDLVLAETELTLDGASRCGQARVGASRRGWHGRGS